MFLDILGWAKSKNIQPRNFLSWHGLIDTIPVNWKKELKSKAIPQTPPFDPQDYNLVLNSAKVSLSEMDTKTFYEAHMSDLRETPTAQLRYNEMFHDSELVWNKIYSLPFQVALDTYTRDFQYKILNRILFTNSKLFKLKLVESPLCSFCDKNEETLEHLFVFCEHSRAFWKEISSWLHECGIETLPDLTDQINIMFGLFDVDNHFMLLNHIMLIAKQTIFLCRQKSITPSFIIFLAHLKKIFRIEEYLAKEKKKLNLHLMKWEKLLQSLS